MIEGRVLPGPFDVHVPGGSPEMRRLWLAIFVICPLLLPTGAGAVLCTVDAVPAATLLLPYFEVDLDDPDGLTTLFSINNASGSEALAHVVIWSDLSVPVLDFDVDLTGSSTSRRTRRSSRRSPSRRSRPRPASSRFRRKRNASRWAPLTFRRPRPSAGSISTSTPPSVRRETTRRWTRRRRR